jgi:hypothetical protein
MLQIVGAPGRAEESSIGAIHTIFVIVPGISFGQSSFGGSARTWSSLHRHEKYGSREGVWAGVGRRRGVG